jgi:hypothetical protein
MTVEEVDNNDVGEHEDDDVRMERQKVSDILSNRSVDPPVVVVQVIYGSSINLGIMMIQNHSLFFVPLQKSQPPQKPFSSTSLVFLLLFVP